jgi:two-component system sensor histidine kinase TctE
MRHTPRGSAFGIDIRSQATSVTMSVWDSGDGIDADREAKLFEPFSTGDPIAGSGLGLIICRDICRSIGARMTLKNRDPDEPGMRGLRATVQFAQKM